MVKIINNLPVILGIGTDIEDIERFKNLSRSKNKSFLEKIFSSQELDYCFSKKDPAPYLAAGFCAKEATIKALDAKLNYRDINIFRTQGKAPVVKISPEKIKGISVYLSMSHSKDKAIAFALVSKN